MESRKRIIKAAIHLFACQGYGSTGLRELAQTAEVNLAMVNYFFGSKKGLLKVILDDFMSGYLDVARRTLPGDEDPQVKINHFITAAITYFEARRDALIVTITELPHDDPDIIAHKAAWGSKMINIIDQEVCRPLSTVSGRNLPGVVIGPMLTSMMASQFLFSPVIEYVRGKQNRKQGNCEYAAVISDVFLSGIVGINITHEK
jgi:AcrR family transcriptional regulator